MCTDPVKQSQTSVAKADMFADLASTADSGVKPARTRPAEDIEGAYHLEELDPVDASAEVASLGNMSFSNIINQIWHFCSVDYGPKCESRYREY